MPYRLVPDRISSTTVDAFEQLAAAARRGEVIGGAFVAMLKGRRFLVNVCGACSRDPVMMRGALLSLDDQLRGLVEDAKLDAPTTL